jgi:hypothetical protein
MHRIATCALLIALAPALGVARQQTAPAAATLTGYIVDANCGARLAVTENGGERAARHTKACALEPSCSAKGYMLYSGGIWYTLDAQGNSLAKGAIAASKKERGHLFEVAGSAKGKTLVVLRLREKE